MNEVSGSSLEEETSYASDLGDGIQLKQVTIEGSGPVPEAFILHYREPGTYDNGVVSNTPYATAYRYPTTQTTNKGDPDAQAGDTMMYLMRSSAQAIDPHPDAPDGQPFPQFVNGVDDNANMRITQGLINELLQKGLLDWNGETDLGGVRFIELL